MATYLVGSQPGRGRARPAGPITLNLDSPQRHGLVGWWPLAGDLTDCSGRQAHLVRTGTLGWSARDLGMTVPTSSASDYATVSGPTFLAAVDTSPFSLMLWAWFPSFPPGGQFFSIGNGSAGINLNYTGGTMAWLRASNGVDVVRQATSYTDFAWRHIVATWDGTTARIYHNGLADGSATSPTVDSGAGTRVGLLTNANAGFPQGPSGGAYVCDARLWNRALPPGEVWALYDPQTRWDLYWQPSTRIVFDISGGGGGTTAPSRFMLLGVR
jgi:hypothetical protein